MTLLKVSSISKQGHGNFLLKDISFLQRRLQKIAVAGETGAGKSTLLKIIAGLMQPDSGVVMFKGIKVKGPDEKLVAGHPGIAYLSQHFELQKFLRVEQVLQYSNVLSHAGAETLYKVCQIDHLLKRRTDQLSGGEKQRIAICRLLISSPGLLLLDEPFSHLDMVHKNTLKSVIQDIGDKLKISCMLVSHDPEDILSWADKILIMKDGRVVQKDEPQAVYRNPVDEYTGGLFGRYNLIPPSMFKVFSKIPDFNRHTSLAGDKSMFLRPENLRLVRKSVRAIRGKVIEASFLGGYRELQILISKHVFVVRTDEDGVRKGDTVYLSIAADHLWFV